MNIADYQRAGALLGVNAGRCWVSTEIASGGLKTVDCVVYLRVSTDEQAVSGLGLEAQASACAYAAERAGWHTAAVCRDEGRSGALELSKRPVLLDALFALKKGDVLLVAKLDRLSRGDPYANALIEHQVAKRGARIVSAAGEGTADDSADSILMRRLMAMLAEREVLIIRERTRRALAAKRARGERCGQVPYGYRLGEAFTIRTSKGDRTSHKLEPNPIEANVIDYIGQLRSEGRSLREIACVIQAKGVPTKSGRPWSHSTVAGILKNSMAKSEGSPA